MRASMIVLAALWLVPAAAQTRPVLKHGTCPAHYQDQGTYCVPTREAGTAFEKADTTCPYGFHDERGYCVGDRNSREPPHDVALHGSTCPSGYFQGAGTCHAQSSTRPVFDKGDGPCPSNYRESGSGYCEAFSDSARHAITKPKNTSCPSGYEPDGGACVERE